MVLPSRLITVGATLDPSLGWLWLSRLLPDMLSKGLGGVLRPVGGLGQGAGLLSFSEVLEARFLSRLPPKMTEPIPARTLGSFTSHGQSWTNGTGRTGHYRLLGWGLFEPWEEQAACHNTPLEWWFGDESPLGVKGTGRTMRQTRQAKAVCASCPVIEDCRAWALESRIPFGVLGGLTERERWEVLHGRPVGKGTRIIR